MKRAIFRCDANSATGLGHLVRCADIAEALQRAAPALDAVFVGDFSSAAQSALGARRLPSIATRPTDGLAVLPGGARQGDWIIVDSYRLVEDDVVELASRGYRVGVVDDFESVRGGAADLVMNFRVRAPRMTRYMARATALGPGYFPASWGLELARDARIARPLAPAVRRVLVLVGGTDRFAVGPVLTKATELAFPECEVVFVNAGVDFPSSVGKVTVLPFQQDLAPLLASVDLVVAGGGRLKYEAAYAQVPCASVSQTLEQAEDTYDLAAQGLCLDLGLAEGADCTLVAKRLVALESPNRRRDMCEVQARLFPRDSAIRLAKAICGALGG
jgi:spore coat polysaccharide biosynthesis predicted glycosyltransferase SpsG